MACLLIISTNHFPKQWKNEWGSGTFFTLGVEEPADAFDMQWVRAGVAQGAPRPEQSKHGGELIKSSAEFLRSPVFPVPRALVSPTAETGTSRLAFPSLTDATT